MNLLIDPFVSTTIGTLSLKQILTTRDRIDLVYGFDETQLACLQLLSSLATALFLPSMEDIRRFAKRGISEQEYDQQLNKINIDWFNDEIFMRSKPAAGEKYGVDRIAKIVSGIEVSTTKNASGLFSDAKMVTQCCPGCMVLLNYNIHMNIKGEPFGAGGSTGIRGGGMLSTMICGDTLSKTIILNMFSNEHFTTLVQNPDVNDTPMWIEAPSGEIYFSHTIGLTRGLFALAYHIDYQKNDAECLCDICGQHSETNIKHFGKRNYKGSYGSTDTGRKGKAGLWPHPFTPVSRTDDVDVPISAEGPNWHSWEHLSSYVIGKEMDKKFIIQAPIVSQYRDLGLKEKTSLLVGGNIADQASITGRIYDLYSFPSSWNENLDRVTTLIEHGLEVKDIFKRSLDKISDSKLDKNLLGGIKQRAVNEFVANTQNIIQATLMDVNKKEAAELRKDAKKKIHSTAKTLFENLLDKYKNDHQLLKALLKGQKILLSIK